MKKLGSKLAGLTGAGAIALAGCVATPPPADPAVRQALAPTGSLRVGVNAGSPTSMVTDPKTGEKSGVAYGLGQALAQRLGVPVQIVEFQRPALVAEAVKTGAVDFTFTNASEARARDMDFTPVMLQVELGYLLPLQSTIASVADMDKDGRRVGVTQGSSSQAALPRLFRNNVTLVAAASAKQAQDMLRGGQMEAFATNKAILSEMLDSLPGFRILEGNWGVENMAIAIPKGRDAAMPYLRQFAQDMRAGGQMQAIVAKAGLRGTRLPD